MQLKIGVLGEPCTGRRMLTMRYAQNTYNDSFDGCPEICRKLVKYKKYTFFAEIWEQGYDNHENMKQQVIRECACFLIVVDTLQSFGVLALQIEAWYKRIVAEKQNEIVPILIVGCKSDLVANTSTIHEQLKNKAQQLGTSYIATSAKQDSQVQEAFEMIFEKAVQVLQKQQSPNKKCLVQ